MALLILTGAHSVLPHLPAPVYRGPRQFGHKRKKGYLVSNYPDSPYKSVPVEVVGVYYPAPDEDAEYFEDFDKEFAPGGKPSVPDQRGEGEIAADLGQDYGDFDESRKDRVPVNTDSLGE